MIWVDVRSCRSTQARDLKDRTGGENGRGGVFPPANNNLVSGPPRLGADVDDTILGLS